MNDEARKWMDEFMKSNKKLMKHYILMERMTKMAWTKVKKMVDVEHVENSMREILESWDGMNNNGVSYAFTELAEKLRIAPDDVLTDKQAKLLRKRGVL